MRAARRIFLVVVSPRGIGMMSVRQSMVVIRPLVMGLRRLLRTAQRHAKSGGDPGDSL